MRPPLQRLLHLNNRLGEGPVWNVNEHELYWVDIDGHCFYRYHPATGAREHFDVGQPIGVLRFRKSGSLVMALRAGIYLVCALGWLERRHFSPQDEYKRIARTAVCGIKFGGKFAE